MAHSFLKLEKGLVHLHDADISRVMDSSLTVFQREFDRNRSNLDVLFDWWGANKSKFGPGCIHLKLDEHLAKKNDREEFLQILVQARSASDEEAEGIANTYFDGSTTYRLDECDGGSSERSFRTVENLLLFGLLSGSKICEVEKQWGEIFGELRSARSTSRIFRCPLCLSDGQTARLMDYHKDATKCELQVHCKSCRVVQAVLLNNEDNGG